MKRYFFLIVILISCQQEDSKKEAVNSDHIVFGHFYGECMGEGCIELYKLTDTNLYEDTNDKYPNSDEPANVNFELRNNTMFEKVKGLKDNVPENLLKTSQKIIGQPDAGDWGGIYFEILIDGEKSFWLIDKKEANLPGYLKPFVDEIENSIELINN